MKNPEKKEHKKWSWKAFWAWVVTSGATTITVFSWELIEEALENVIALGITSAIAVLSTVVLVFATQASKLVIKKIIRFLFPIVKSKIYKEGNDKMELLKKYLTKVWGNKVTGGIAGVGFATTAYFALDTILSGWWLILAIVGAFIIAYNIAIFFGGETIAQIQARWAEVSLTKEEKQKAKKVNDKVKELAKKLESNQKKQLLAQATAMIEAEAQKVESETSNK